MKKLSFSLCALLLAALILCTFPFHAQAVTSGACGENVTWTLDDSGTLTISGTGAMEDYTSLSDIPWYSQRESITAVIIGSGVTSIGDRTFFSCTALTDLTIGEDVLTIGAYAFRGCTALEAVTIPGSVTELKDSAFRACTALTVVTFSGNAPTMGSEVFNDGAASLTIQYYEGSTGYDVYPWTKYAHSTMHVGQWIVDVAPTCTTGGSRHIDCAYCQTTITEALPIRHTYVDGICTVCDEIKILARGTCGTTMWWELNALGTLTVSGSGEMSSWSDSSEIPWYPYREKILEVVIEDGVTGIGDNAFYFCGSMTGITIPDSVTSIGDYAFTNCINLTGVTIPDGVTDIGDYAFRYCWSLTSITIPDGVTSIGVCTFEDCRGLTDVTLPDGLTSIGNNAFQYCASLTGITIPEGVTSIGGGAFRLCRSLTSITLPDSLTSIGGYAFDNCIILTGITLPDSLTSLGSGAFYGCSSLTGIAIPDGVTSIGDHTFDGCSSLTSITLPDSLTSIGAYAFHYCSLTSVTLPDSLTSIGDHAFVSCDLTSITIPEGVTSIGSWAFNWCSNLTCIALPESLTSIGEDAFLNCSSLDTVFYPAVKEHKSNISFGSSNSYLSDATWHYEVEEQEQYGKTVYYCPECECYYTPEGFVTENGTVYGRCGINLTWTLDREGTLTISGTGKMENYEYGISPWFDNEDIKSVIINKGATTIGDYAFACCENLTSITYPDSLSSIGAYAYHSCNSLTSATIPASVEEMGTGVFAMCENLTEITFVGNAPAYVGEAMQDLTATCYYPADNATWTESVFSDCKGNITWIPYSNRVVIPTITGKSFSLSFEDEILVNFYYTVSDLTDVVEHGMLVFYTNPETVDCAKADAVYDAPVFDSAKARYMATTDGIAAKEMGDTRYYVAYAKLTDGTYAYSAAYDYSPKKYSLNMLSKDTTSDKQKALCVAMLNYGAAAQTYFGYNTDALMNAELTAEQQALVIAYNKTLFTGAVPADANKVGSFATTAAGFSKKSATVSFESAVSINYYFTLSDIPDGQVMFYYWTPEDYANAATLSPKNASGSIVMEDSGDGRYWAQVSDIAAKAVDETYYVAVVYYSELELRSTGVIAYSLSQYCLSKAVDGNDMQQLASATAMYGYYAKQYFA